MKDAALFGEPATLVGVLAEVMEERGRQEGQWGEQNHADGISPRWNLVGQVLEIDARRALQREGASWAPILLEEVGEALTSDSVEALRAELLQVAAVAVAWAEAIDRRQP